MTKLEFSENVNAICKRLLTFGDEQAAFREFAPLYREYAELEAAADAEKASTEL